MAHVTVRLFAALGDVVAALSLRFGERFASVAGAGSVVVDGERADGSIPLAEGQEVALLPPVSGGRTPPGHLAPPRPGDERDPHPA